MSTTPSTLETFEVNLNQIKQKASLKIRHMNRSRSSDSQESSLDGEMEVICERKIPFDSADFETSPPLL